MTATLQHGSTGDDIPVDVPVAEDEARRVAALHALGVLDQPRQADLDAAARLAAYVCRTPTAAVNLIDGIRQWQAAAYGMEPGEVDRRDALGEHTITGTDVVYTPDARSEPRFADNPFVTGRLGQVRLYASAPLVTREGLSIGTVCVYDEASRELDATQLGLLRDIADQVMALLEMRQLAAAVARTASRDPLTGLANRRGVETALSAAVARAERGLGTPSVVVVDLDGFTEVNETLGQHAGDELLRAVGDRLVQTARAVDTVGRLGGDEFVVLLEHTGGPGAGAALRRLRGCLEEPFTAAGGARLAVGAALGITTYRPGDQVASLLARADAEMFADKARRSADRASADAAP